MSAQHPSLDLSAGGYIIRLSCGRSIFLFVAFLNKLLITYFLFALSCHHYFSAASRFVLRDAINIQEKEKYEVYLLEIYLLEKG